MKSKSVKLSKKLETCNLYRTGIAAIDRENPGSESYRQVLKKRWGEFCLWLIALGVTEPWSLTREHVIRYGKSLKARFTAGEFTSTTTLQNKLYSVNRIIGLLDSQWENVTNDECGLSTQSIIPKVSVHYDDDDATDIPELTRYLLDLQKTLGLRLNEAYTLDLSKALAEGRKTGHITVYSPTDGSRRQVPCNSEAIKAIALGVASRRTQHTLHKALSHKEIMLAHKTNARRSGYTVNSSRGEYMRRRYREIVGVNPPILSDWDNELQHEMISTLLGIGLTESKRLDKQAKITILRELGELGLDTLDKYMNKLTNNQSEKEHE